MKRFILLLSGILAFAGCGEHRNAELRKAVPGTWLLAIPYPGGEIFKGTTTIASNGSFNCQTIVLVRSNTVHGMKYNIVRTVRFEGTVQIKDGLYIETTTHHSDTNKHVPYTLVARIVRVNDNEMALLFGGPPGTPFVTTETVFQRVRR